MILINNARKKTYFFTSVIEHFVHKNRTIFNDQDFLISQQLLVAFSSFCFSLQEFGSCCFSWFHIRKIEFSKRLMPSAVLLLTLPITKWCPLWVLLVRFIGGDVWIRLQCELDLLPFQCFVFVHFPQSVFALTNKLIAWKNTNLYLFMINNFTSIR